MFMFKLRTVHTLAKYSILKRKWRFSMAKGKWNPVNTYHTATEAKAKVSSLIRLGYKAKYTKSHGSNGIVYTVWRWIRF